MGDSHPPGMLTGLHRPASAPFCRLPGPNKNYPSAMGGYSMGMDILKDGGPNKYASQFFLGTR